MTSFMTRRRWTLDTITYTMYANRLKVNHASETQTFNTDNCPSLDKYTTQQYNDPKHWFSRLLRQLTGKTGMVNKTS